MFQHMPDQHIMHVVINIVVSITHFLQDTQKKITPCQFSECTMLALGERNNTGHGMLHLKAHCVIFTPI